MKMISSPLFRHGTRAIALLSAFFVLAAAATACSGPAQHPAAVSRPASDVPAAPPASSASVSHDSLPGSSAPKSAPGAAPGPASAVSPAENPKSLAGSAMLGNSYSDELDTFGLLPQMDFYNRVGLSVLTVFTKTTASGKVPVIDELKRKPYRRVYLMFGENELGWEGTKAFVAAYGKVIDAVRQRQPGAKIYIQSIFPISAAESAKNIDNANNARIREYNEQLRILAQQKNAVYLDVASVMADKSGNFPADAATDGIHPTIKYCKIWAQYLETHS